MPSLLPLDLSIRGVFVRLGVRDFVVPPPVLINEVPEAASEETCGSEPEKVHRVEHEHDKRVRE